jgi:eukaryotic-like serine/threonine-protein kinase
MIGQTFGNYRVTALIGEGGMGVVYSAEHPTIGRRAAVKILRPGLTENVEITKRFFNEARAANAIRHPGIVEVFDSGTLASGVSYIVMELLEGESLAARLRRIGRFGPLEARAIVAQTASALAAAHAAGIVHRDLKPDNLFLVPDYRETSSELVKVLDFGIAKLGLDASRSISVKTRTGSVMGTPAYMSPEQCRGTKEVDHRADIYALGVILYEMVCGRPPFVSEGFGEMVHLHISEPPPPPRSLVPGIPQDLERVILWCLAKDPEQRLGSMTELQAALSGRPTAPPRPAPRPTLPNAATAAAMPPSQPTTFTQAAHASDLATDVGGRSRKGRWFWASLLLVAVGAGMLFWRTRSALTPVAETMPAAGAPAATTTPAMPAPPPDQPAPVRAAIVSTPGGARVVRDKDGAVMGMTPFRETWPRRDGIEKFRVELDGYRPETVVVPLDRGVDLSLTLRPIAVPAQKPAREKSKERPRAVKQTTPRPATPGSQPPAAPAPPAPKPAARPEPVPL